MRQTVFHTENAIEANHEVFAQDGTVVRSPEVDALLATPAPSVLITASRD